MIEIRKSGSIWKSKFALFIGVDESNLHFMFPLKIPVGDEPLIEYRKKPSHSWITFCRSSWWLNTDFHLLILLGKRHFLLFALHTQNSTEKNSGKWSFFIKCFFSFFIWPLCLLFISYSCLPTECSSYSTAIHIHSPLKTTPKWILLPTTESSQQRVREKDNRGLRWERERDREAIKLEIMSALIQEEHDGVLLSLIKKLEHL